MKIAFTCVCALLGSSVLALPSKVISSQGAFQIEQKGAHLEVTADSGARLQWQAFSIDQGESVRFALPSAQSVVINKVVGSDPSQIFGSLLSNGHVYLINPAGILIGKEARIDTAGFIATTLDMILDNDGYRFQGDSSAKIQIDGNVIAREGDLVIVGSKLQVNGGLECLNGNAFLAGSKDVYISMDDIGNLTVDPAADINSAVLQFNGKIAAQNIALTGGVVDCGSAALLNAPSGEIHIGTSPWVSSKEENAVVLFPKGALASVDGDGGRIFLVSKGATIASGHLSARGGSTWGNGGFIEISGHHLDCTATVDTTAPFGRVGEVLFDPIDLQIIPGAVDTNVGLVILPGPLYEYTASASPSTISFNTINTALDVANVTVRSSGAAGPDLGDLILIDNYTITTIGTNTLTLEAFRDIQIGAALIYPTPGSIVLRSVANGIGVGGATGQVGNAFVSVSNGDLTFDGDCSISGVGGGPYYAYAEAPQGNIFVTSNASGISIRGGNGVGAFAQLGSPVATGGVVNSNIIVNADLDFRIVAGNAVNAYAQLGHGSGALPLVPGTINGDITLNGNDGLLLSGRNAQGAYAQIGHRAGDLGTVVNINGDISATFANNVVMTGGNSPGDAYSQIGHGSVDVTSESYTGSVEVIAGGQYIMVGGNTDSPVTIGHRIDSSTGPMTVNAPLIHVVSNSALSFEMTGGSGNNSDAVVGVALNNVAGGSILNANIQVDVAGDLNMNPAVGTSSSQISLGDALGPTIVGNVLVDVAGDININMIGSGGAGGVGINVPATFQANNIVTVRARNCTATSDATGVGFGSNGSLVVDIQNDLTFTSGGAGSSAVLIGLDSIDVTCGNNFTFSTTAVGGIGSFVRAFGSAPGDIFIQAGNNVLLLDSTGALPPLSSRIVNSGGGEIHVLAGLNMIIQSGCSIDAAGGDINLVVDNDFPAFPGIGPGSFQLNANSLISVSKRQNIRLFTARQNQNSIQGTLSQGGVTVTGFTGGPLFADVPPERWGVYYFDPFFYAGQIFTIFYKDFLQEIAEVGNTVVSEALFGFNSVNEFAGWPDVFNDLWRFAIFYNHDAPRSSSLRLATDEYYWLQRARFHFIRYPEVHR